ncbi:MAG TPA: ribosome assembly RNA-binding protein YhbY [Candidatus Pseudogracilibacillus intestinigallinarum]|uniref:Ribosome assembly RNA-binding protein YhbY n=1 Tax=Candidatus Pseudogracilibacillus intestinigallinarum TaxID=2838742 RepID=A0A9D1PPG4_9BACI|nr:ribosome assembly RNA-binding protein YhbY [Candidatus Pseudogracilibacillus intestinigallinarum]
MLTGKQKRFLRAKAHHEKPLFQIGKGGVNENLTKQLDDLLEKRELIKVAVLQNCLEEKDDIAAQLVDGTDACLVQIIGNTIVLYRESVENKTITLPN